MNDVGDSNGKAKDRMKRMTPATLALVALVACGRGNEPARESARATADPALTAGFGPLPAAMASQSNPATAEKVALGRMLYYDTRVSASGDVSCYVCHPLHDYGTSHRRTGVGHDGLIGGRNEPTVYNAAGHVAQFWDGRAPDVEAQALGPVLNPVEMGMPNGEDVVAVLREIPGYVDAFQRAFPGQAEPVTFENFGRAIGAFERGLVTPSRWDAFLEGDTAALSADETRGLETFVQVGCATCHTGTYVGGSVYRKIGVVKAWPDASDAGRYQVTGLDADRQVFKVPSLRNVEETWPYFHAGSVQRLDDAVRLMGLHQLGVQLTDAQVAYIRAWLRTLTGPVPLDYINEPVLPPSAGPSGLAGD